MFYPTTNEKILSVVVPSYNSQLTLEYCLSSFLNDNLPDDRLEVIVVDDGSSDSTAQLARKYVEKHPTSFSLIQKRNGGHGSAINIALLQAKGRYFKVVDSDDAVDSENFITLLDRLSQTDVDVVINDFVTVHVQSKKQLRYSAHCKYCNKCITVSDMMSIYDKIGACCSIHGITYKTELLISNNFKLSEGVFYEDNEYAILPFLYVETVLLLPFVVYKYTVGDGGQSMAVHNQVKRIQDKEKVIHRICSETKKVSSLNPSKKEYVRRRALALITGYFVTALIMDKDQNRGRSNATSMIEYLTAFEPDLWRKLLSRYSIIKLCGTLHMKTSLYQSLVDNAHLRKMLRKILK